jgi:branched-chain amino acid transport system substrate-binding protein
MSRKSSLRTSLISLLTFALVLPVSANFANAAGDINIGVITSTSGGLKSQSEAYIDGLEWGLKYFTNGKSSVNGRKIVVTKRDDSADPLAATAAFKELVGKGTNIIVGTASSQVGLTLAPLAAQNKVLYISGLAKNDYITTPANKYVFRSGNTSQQDVAPLTKLRPIRGKKFTVIVEDGSFGLGSLIATKAFLIPKGAIIEEIKIPAATAEFTPFAKKAAELKGDYIFVAWSNASTASTLFNSLDQQKAYANARLITALPGVDMYETYGALLDGVNAILTSSYFPGVVKNNIATKLATDFAKAGKTPDLDTYNGVNAAQMIIQAVKSNSNLDVEKMITSLEKFSFIGLTGLNKVNKLNHTLIQSMFLVKLTKINGRYTPSLVSTDYNVTV